MSLFESASRVPTRASPLQRSALVAYAHFPGRVPLEFLKLRKPWKVVTLYQVSQVSCSCVQPVGRYAVAQFPLSSKGFPPAESQIRAGEFEVHFELRTDDETSPRFVLHSMGGESAQLRWQLSGMALSLPVKTICRKRRVPK